MRKIRICLALGFFGLLTLLFLDFTGAIHGYLGWIAKLQLVPALMSLNLLSLLFLVALTLLFGRIYCSVICPLGVFQDIANHFGSFGKRKFRFQFQKERKKTRWLIFFHFFIGMFFGLSIFTLIAPYSAYGRIATYLFSPAYKMINNGLAYLAERFDSYAFYETDVFFKGLSPFLVALSTFVILFVLAFFKGRAYCNTVCPVGTLLGLISKFSFFKPTIDKEKCIHCKKCERSCKSSCIDTLKGEIDYSRCVSCYNCLEVCSKKAINIRWKKTSPAKKNEKIFIPQNLNDETSEKNLPENSLAKTPAEISANEKISNGTPAENFTPEKKFSEDSAEKTSAEVDQSRRKFLSATAIFMAGAACKIRAEENGAEGGLAPIIDKEALSRTEPIVPPGAKSLQNLLRHCTGCGLCIAACPNDCLRPGFLTKPVVGYEKGYCRPECNRCSQICPSGAILPISLAEKSSTQIGHAVWDFQRCVVLFDKVSCGNCARHCPTGAIQMIPSDPNDPTSPQIPAVNTERCIGCGACENLCPARPKSAIYVEGHEVHRTI